jgi:tRNA dimethylallyltransferase
MRRERISERLRQRFSEGMVDEVRELLNQGCDPETLIYYGLEYKYITLFITGRLSYDEMYRELETAIHRFAKRQMTWFRGMERKGIKIHWIDGELPMEKKVEQVMNLLF